MSSCPTHLFSRLSVEVMDQAESPTRRQPTRGPAWGSYAHRVRPCSLVLSPGELLESPCPSVSGPLKPMEAGLAPPSSPFWEPWPRTSASQGFASLPTRPPCL